MKGLALSFLCLAPMLSADARIFRVWHYQELSDAAQLIVIAKRISTRDTAEEAILRDIRPDVHVTGLSSEFAVDVVLKGSKDLKKLVLHHYRLASIPSASDPVMFNGPSLASFDADKAWTRYLLFLVSESDGRYAPVSGQTDPAGISMIRLEGDVP
jgi:hypothetical protein